MCAATAAAVGTAVAAVAAVGTQVAGAVSSGGSSGGGTKAPQTKEIKGFGPATGLQSYTARLLAANRNTRTPGIQEWAASGGTLRPDWKVPDFTAREATQLQFVEPRTGRPMPGFDPDTETRLSGAAQAQLGRERSRKAKDENRTLPADPQARYGALEQREEMLRARIAERGTTPRLEKKLTKVTAKKERVGGRF